MKSLVVVICFLTLFFAGQAAAEVASSTNYQIEIDSLNIGGNLSTSTTYDLEDTLGEPGTGTSSSAVYQIRAGYREMLDSSISISAPANITLTTLDTATGGTVTDSVSWTVITDNPAGYTLAVKAATTPALKSTGDTFTDYTPAGAVPDYTWSIGSTAAEFGFSPEGTHITTRYKDNGAACGVGALNTSNTCWDSLSTTSVTMASSTSSNTPTGTATTVKFQAEIGADKTLIAGAYTATITATALAQ